MKTFGLDVLGAGLWVGVCGPRGGTQPSVHKPGVHDMLLPLYIGEPLVGFEPARVHRRGSGLKWPPEAQVPVLGDGANGWGRRHLIELWELLQVPKGLVDRTASYPTEVSWRPDGAKAITLGAEKLLCHVVRSSLSSEHQAGVLGLVVPEDLAPHGQQLLIDGLGGADKVMLTPAAVAAALDWCRAELARSGHKASRDQKTLGYVDVIDVGLGRWGVARFDVVLHRHDGEAWLSPLRSSASRAYPADGTTGLELLAKGMGVPEGMLSAKKVEESLFQGLPLELGAALQSLRRQLQRLEAIRRDFPIPSDDGTQGRCLTTLVIGDMEGVNVHGGPFIDLIDETFSLYGQYQVVTGDLLAQSAAYVVGGRTHGWPTWLERLEPIEFHCHRESPEGDMEDFWINVAHTHVIDASREFRAENIVKRDLIIQAGATSLSQHLKVAATPPVIKRADFLLNSRDTPTAVTLNLRARPGQGYAIVEIKEKEDGALVSTLDWGRMQVVQHVPPLHYGYIPQVVTHKYHPNFEASVLPVLEKFLDAAERLKVAARIVDYARPLRIQLSRWTSASRMPPSSIDANQRKQPFVVYSLIPQDIDDIPVSSVRSDLRKLVRLAGELANERARERGPSDVVCEALDLLLGWTYRSCPSGVVKRRLARVIGEPTVRAVDLAVVGLSLCEDADIGKVVERIMREIANENANNNWYRCLRNLSRYNQHAFRHVSDTILEGGVKGLIAISRKAVRDDHPSILRNCVEALVHVLKRRRYSKEFLEVGTPLCDSAKSAMVYAQRSGTFTPAIRKQLEAAIQLIDKRATLENIVVVVDADDSEDDN